MFDVPPDFINYRPEDATPEQRDAMGKRVPEYDRIVPGLGRFTPVDMRPLLEHMGVEFQPGHYALADETRGFLLMKGSNSGSMKFRKVASGGA